MQIIVKPTGVFISVYDDAFDYGDFCKPQIRRVSQIEPDDSGGWIADLSPINGPKLGSFDKRNEAIEAELEYVNAMLAECEPQE